MIVTWRFLSILSLVSYTESECFSTSYYRNCWIRRFPGLHVDAEESQRRGAQLLQRYRGDSAQNCSRACCLTSNFSCNVAVFHYNTTQDSVNCFHLHCPTLQSCILHQKANVILYNVTKGMDPDLLIFGKSIPTNVQVLPHLASLNASDLSGTDKRQFNRPHMEPGNSGNPTAHAKSLKTSTTPPTSIFPISTLLTPSDYSTQDNQDTLPSFTTQRSITPKQSSQPISTPDPAIVSTTKASSASRGTMQPPFGLTNKQTSSMSQTKIPSSTKITPSQIFSQLTPSSTISSQVDRLGITTAYTISQTTPSELQTSPLLAGSTTFSTGYTTTIRSSSGTPQSSTEETSMPVPLTSTLESSTEETTTPVPLTSTLESSTEETSTPVPLTSTLESSTEETSTPVPLTSTLKSSTEGTSTPVPLTSTLESSTEETSTLLVQLTTISPTSTGETTTLSSPISNALQSKKRKPPTTLVPLSSTVSVPASGISQSNTERTATMAVPLSSALQGGTEDTWSTPAPPLSSTLQSKGGKTTNTSFPLSSILQSNKGETTTHTTLAMDQPSSTNASLVSNPLTSVKTTTGYAGTTTGPQVITDSSNSRSHNQPINTQTLSPLIEKIITPPSTTGGQSQGYTNINLLTTDISVTTIRPTTLNKLRSSVTASETNSDQNTSSTPPTVIDDSQPYPNDTKGYISRNATTGNSPQSVSDGGLPQVWHLAANTVLVALATCAALACGCCCSVLMAASWKGRRRRKGRYQTTLRGKKGSMRLIKYVFVRESS
ncbi:mucin-5AC-like [Clarias gariepinus]|uniref:mucin-5AC-like n=1 Tax=Clarias gariepinus TaxID=13013 RepID=UPI00234C7D4F|nr:mucin-5AC-like [Clarias gariepinus]